MAIPSTNKPVRSAATSENYRPALTVLTTLFFMWGFLTALNDILVPHLKPIFDLNYTQIMLIQFAFFSSYFVFSIPAGKLTEWLGYKRALVAGLITLGAGALLFIPAASVASYPLFLGALIVLAGGMTILQVAANPYVSVLGPPETASSRLNLTQAFNSLGTTIAPFLGGLIILGTVPVMSEIRAMAPDALQAFRVHQASSVKLPYLGLGLIALALAAVIASFKLPTITSAERHPGDVEQSIWRYRHLILGAIGIFVYVGAEVSIGSFLVNYFSQPNIGNITEKVASGFVSFYWGGAMIGRFIGSVVLQKVKTGIVLGAAAIMACLLVCVSMLTLGHVAMWSIILVGFFNSIMFPSIFTSGIAKLGPMTSKGSSLMIMAIVGGAILPVLTGALADRIGIQHAFIIPAVCYLFIMYYGFKGSEPTGPGITA